MCRIAVIIAAWLLASGAHAATVTVKDEAGGPLATVMVTQTVTDARKLDTADGGYATPGKTQLVDVEVTRFTDSAGMAILPDRAAALTYRLRKPGFRDTTISTTQPGEAPPAVVLVRENDPFALAAAKPANAWLGALDIGDAATKRHFMLQCAFCHQQGNEFIRMERTPQVWADVIYRMIGYGYVSRAPTRRRCQPGWRAVIASCVKIPPWCRTWHPGRPSCHRPRSASGRSVT